MIRAVNGSGGCDPMISVQDYDRRVTSFFDQAVHPTLGHPYRACGYLPMVELLRYLEANGFANYIASGGDRDFMRPGGPDRPALRLLLHDDADREFDDRGGAEQALDEPPPTAGRWSASSTTGRSSSLRHRYDQPANHLAHVCCTVASFKGH